MDDDSIKKAVERRGSLTFEYRTENIAPFGARYFIRVIKECQNKPGFDPPYVSKNLGDLVMRFKDRENEPYWLVTADCTRLEPTDIQHIYEAISQGFDKSKHPTKEEVKAYLRGE